MAFGRESNIAKAEVCNLKLFANINAKELSLNCLQRVRSARAVRSLSRRQQPEDLRIRNKMVVPRHYGIVPMKSASAVIDVQGDGLKRPNLGRYINHLCKHFHHLWVDVDVISFGIIVVFPQTHSNLFQTARI